MKQVTIRKAQHHDLGSILHIYNQGIEDRIATLELDTKDLTYMDNWFQEHQGRYTVLVAEVEGSVVGWASLNRYSHRCAYNGVADLSVYVDRSVRGRGVGNHLLEALETEAKNNGFYKIVLFTFPFNGLGQGLYRKRGFREVGVFEKQGILDGQFVDVMAMEKIL
ncbi:phosphinothricin acetyltransferase [Brevibacillus aydinogluensis]|jgi:L-amino acid N-acyltransferase YncA|uniref:arsinothricin resistance N-acetyltransferase ArsN1 family A n=1 Tax=Brevibacillus TaxID=55080 RepID=UPI001B97C182|nr:MULTISPECIES: arsinothricin resistance N-acetyltransferase ArsN1 family A [Brevibacillus]MBR8660660.1 N-acetyltransferase [Brevibacillus sp. NL20B1]MDT3417405.1 phosphinothricin acetyltransferase [Brevibacillus aydinogluensis]